MVEAVVMALVIVAAASARTTTVFAAIGKVLNVAGSGKPVAELRQALWFVLTGRSRVLRDEGGGPFSLMHPGRSLETRRSLA